jgi:hypothetical protein
MIALDLYEYKNMLMEMMELGTAAYIMRTTPAKDLISQREAYREFGEARVKNWSSRLSKKRIGTASRSKILYSRTELLAFDRSEKQLKNKQNSREVASLHRSGSDAAGTKNKN